MDNFKVGQKVVCINGIWYRNGEPNHGPKKGDTLEIAAFCSCECGYLKFEEWEGETYYPGSFRPLEEDFAEEVLEKAEKEFNKEILVLDQPKTKTKQL